LGFEKSQRSVTHDSLRYINIPTYLLTYLLNKTRMNYVRIWTELSFVLSQSTRLTDGRACGKNSHEQGLSISCGLKK